MENRPDQGKVSGELQEKGAEAGKPQGQPGNRPVGAIRAGVQGSRLGQCGRFAPGEGESEYQMPPRTECVRGPRKGFLGIHTSQSPRVSGLGGFVLPTALSSSGCLFWGLLSRPWPLQRQKLPGRKGPARDGSGWCHACPQH